MNTQEKDNLQHIKLKRNDVYFKEIIIAKLENRKTILHKKLRWIKINNDSCGESFVLQSHKNRFLFISRDQNIKKYYFI